ncbi:hypothetical protein LINPERPRIM_LOCUS4305 [Linum perenne]
MEKLNFFVVLILLVSVVKMEIGAEAGRISTTDRRGGGVLEPPCEVPCKIGCFCEDTTCDCPCSCGDKSCQCPPDFKHAFVPTFRAQNN